MSDMQLSVGEPGTVIQGKEYSGVKLRELIVIMTSGGLTLVPDGVMRGVDLWPRTLLYPGQSCSTGHLSSFTGRMAIILGNGAALHLIRLGATGL